LFNLETGVERDEDGVVLGSTRLSGSQRLHRKGDATREAGSLVGPMTAADSPSAISVFRFKAFRSAAAASSTMPPKEREALSGQCSSLSGASNFGVRVQFNFIKQSIKTHNSAHP
jgi:hypothetical protein